MEINQELIDKIKNVSENKWFVNKYYSFFANDSDVIEAKLLFNEHILNNILFSDDYISFSKFNHFEITEDFNDETNKYEKWIIIKGKTIAFWLPSNTSIDYSLKDYFSTRYESEINNLLNSEYYISDEKLKEFLISKIEHEYKKNIKELNQMLSKNENDR